ncbi:Glutamate receptor ionotropic, kainate 4 [Larimichthys crocea]|uniref:Uncharacterized protein n=1 Tax=Larimichthys crocea TaxID=215358 RepID=A0ACD3QKX8_LARCR|nr:Glutamate receptor ionotropic, kainate 4 [Larimichthys crocea]
MLRPNHQELQGNDRYEGFCVDMLKELADILKFKYRIRLVGDGLYGVPGANGTWSGMVGELISRKADLAVAGLTITAEREKHQMAWFHSVNFLMNVAVSQLFYCLPSEWGMAIFFTQATPSILRREQSQARNSATTAAQVEMSQCLQIQWPINHQSTPKTQGVWLFMLLAYLAVSCVLFLVARLTPYEWYNPHPCLKGRCNLLINQYSLGNSFWFPVGGFMQQGSTIAPRALSTRCVSGVGIHINHNLIVHRQPGCLPNSPEDGGADRISRRPGRSDGNRNSRYQTYQRMWNFMHSKQPSVFVKSTEEGIARVLNSNYAYLLESTMNEYYRQRNCNLTQIGGLLDTKGYGIGMPLGSVYRDEFDLAILKMQEDNRLEILKRKWWDGGKCPKEEDHRAKGLGMENIGGIFVVLVCGLLVAIFMAVLEFVWMLRQTPGNEQSVCEEMLRELQGIVLCRDSLQLRRRRATSMMRPRPLPLEERRARAATVSLSNGKLCGGTGLPEPLSHRLAQEAALVARGCSHIRICPECRRFQGLRMRPAGATGALPSPTHSEESIEWDKTTNSSEPE